MMEKNFLIAIIVIIVMIVLVLVVTVLMSACAGPDNDSVADDSGEFKTSFRFIVTSDTHVSTVTDTTAARLAQLLRSSYAYAEKQEYKDVDALVVVGDLTNYGQVSEYKAFKTVVDANINEDTKLITVMGNHEFYGGTEKEYEENIDAELNKHVVIDGYHFIGISTKGEGDYSEDLEWLETELAAAAEEDPDKPIITFQHHHIKDTVYVSSEWYAVQSEELNDIYSKYSRVLNFSGHSHGPINNPTSVYQSDYTLFGTGTLAYFEMTSGMTYGTIPPNADQAAQFYIVEISKDNRVRVLPYNLLTDDFFKTPDGSQQLVYEINDLKDKSTWLYTSERAANSAPPAFAETAAITIGAVDAATAEITFPQAADDDCVYSYHIVCTSADGRKIGFHYFSEYYFEPMPETLTFTVSGLASGTDYTVDVYPVDVFGIKGEAISAEFTTGVPVSYEYESANPVNFAGTFTNFDSMERVTISENNFAYGGTVNGDVFVGTWNSSATDENTATVS